MKYENRIIHGNALTVLQKIPDNAFDMVITSPPYWGLRNYSTDPQVWDADEDCEHEWTDDVVVSSRHTEGETNPGKEAWYKEKDASDKQAGQFCTKCGAWKGELGTEPFYDLYVKHLCDIFDEVKRTLKPTGSVWVNIGDCFSSGVNLNDAKKLTGATTGSPIKADLPAKCLCMIPARFKIEMINRGWTLRNDIIWFKPNSMPSSVRDRFTIDYEYIFLFTQNRRYFFEQQYERGSGVVSIHTTSNKYTLDSGHTKRQGLDRKPSVKEKRAFDINMQNFLPYQNKIAKYIQSYIMGEKDKKLLDAYFGEHKWRHWTRTDESGASLPGPDQWLELKELLGFDNTYDEMMTKTVEYLDDGTQWTNKGRNKRAVWKIPTKPFAGAHFAVFPEALIETPMKAACPEKVCRDCGVPVERLTESEPGFDEKGLCKTCGQPKNKHHQSKKSLLRYDSKEEREYIPCGYYKHVGYTQCDCDAGFVPGIVLDPFMGSGTVAVVAKQMGRRFTGIELNKEYIELATKRLKSVVRIRRLE